jgi:hypothetical protein
MADGFSIHYESAEVQAMTNRLLGKVQHPGPLMNTIKRYTKAITMKMFRGRRPDNAPVRGVRWPKLKDSTIKSKKAKMKRGKAIATRPMVETGKTRDSLKVLESSKRGFLFGTRHTNKGFPFPGMHNAGRFPFLFYEKKDYAQMVRMTIDHLKDSLKGFKSYSN